MRKKNGTSAAKEPDIFSQESVETKPELKKSEHWI